MKKAATILKTKVFPLALILVVGEGVFAGAMAAPARKLSCKIERGSEYPRAIGGTLKQYQVSIHIADPAPVRPSDPAERIHEVIVIDYLWAKTYMTDFAHENDRDEMNEILRQHRANIELANQECEAERRRLSGRGGL